MMIYPWMVGGLLLALMTVNGFEAADVIVTDQWFTQYLDHFTITDNRQWKQKYQPVTDFYKEGGPVFLELGGEWAINNKTLPRHTTVIMAKKFNAMVFQLEHRFYGESRPTSDITVENLIYLSAEQALADAAYFVRAMNTKYKLPEGTKWITFGGSYGGSLAAWMRDKYSHLVYAAVADSAPLEAKVDFYEYNNVVRDVLAEYNPECVTEVQKAYLKVKELLKTPEGQAVINKKFNLCDPIDTSNHHDVTALLGALADNFSGLVQYNGSYNFTFKNGCDVMVNTSLVDVVDRYALLNTLVETQEGNPDCLNYVYQPGIDYLKNTSWSTTTRPFWYQYCTEFGYFQSSHDPSHFFFEDLPVSVFFDLCTAVFGENFNKTLIYKGEHRTNTIFGGYDCQATRVAYFYGKTDPWHVLGNSKTKVAESPVILIKDTAHTSMGYEPKDNASPYLKAAWQQLIEILEKWCAS